MSVGEHVRFYLETHQPAWLGRFEIPMFVSRRSLARVKTLPRARGEWALDSGGFTELQIHGRWSISAAAYAREVGQFAAEIGRLEWAAPQDWMCEPAVRAGGGGFHGTGLSTREHQARTVANFLELRSLAPALPWVPVVQGWTEGEYLDCVEAYDRAGIDLRDEPLVGVGSVCRRQGTLRVAWLLRSLAAEGLRLHGFGIKIAGLRSAARSLVSADSMAWSMTGRHQMLKGHDRPGEGRRTGHKSCANCSEFAFEWRRELLAMRTEAA